MNPEQLKQFIILNDEFISRCNSITCKLSKINRCFSHTDNYSIYGDDVVCTGSYLPWGENHYEFVEAKFPVSLLTATDEEVDAYIRKELNIIEKKIEERNRMFAVEQRERELKKLDELKKKYPDV